MIKIVYIAGDGRSGSTLLDGILATVEGTLSIGEAHRFWVRYYEGDTNCGCDTAIQHCELWNAVAQKLEDSFPLVGPDYFTQKVKEVQYFKNYHKISELQKNQDWKPFFEMVPLFYRTISEVSGKSIIIDSSKSISWARVLQELNFCELKMIHLERNLAEVVNSWKKDVVLKEYLHKEKKMPKKSTALAVKSWLKVKLMARELRKNGAYYFIKYNALWRFPKSTIIALEKFIEEPIPYESLKYQKTHAIGGNPSRGYIGEPIEIFEKEQSLSKISIFEGIMLKCIHFMSKILQL